MAMVLHSRHRSKLAVGFLAVAVAVVWTAWPRQSIAQQAPAFEDGADDTGVRFTPGMARSFSRLFTQEVLKQRYQLPEEKMEEAQELVARRLMQMAHKMDEPGRDLIERFIEEQLAHDLERGQGGGGGFVPPNFGKEFADRTLSILPDVREMLRGVSQDVRPLLPMKQQLKMAGDMMALKTGVDGFEETMKKWSSGEVTDYGNPFDRREKPKMDEQGQSERLKGARNAARSESERSRAKQWENYVEKFKQLYGLDAAQISTADSILREYSEREQRLIAEPGWRDRVYRSRLWSNMVWEIESAWNHPAKWLIDDNLAEVGEPLEVLEDQFKARLESIPTSAQRQAVEQRIQELLKEKKLVLPEVKQ